MANYKCKYDGLNSNSKLYRAWASMKSRCSNPNDPSYERYGARGITVCDEWMDFAGFKKWALANGYKEDANHMRECSLDRINNNGNYEPDNCRWATKKEQANNRRNTPKATIDGVTKTLAEWSEFSGVNRKTLCNRYYDGVRGIDLLRKAEDTRFKDGYNRYANPKQYAPTILEAEEQR